MTPHNHRFVDLRLPLNEPDPASWPAPASSSMSTSASTFPEHPWDSLHRRCDVWSRSPSAAGRLLSHTTAAALFGMLTPEHVATAAQGPLDYVAVSSNNARHSGQLLPPPHIPSRTSITPPSDAPEVQAPTRCSSTKLAAEAAPSMRRHRYAAPPSPEWGLPLPLISATHVWGALATELELDDLVLATECLLSGGRTVSPGDHHFISFRPRSRAELRAELERLRSRRGVARLRHALMLSQDGSANVLATKLRLAILRLRSDNGRWASSHLIGMAGVPVPVSGACLASATGAFWGHADLIFGPERFAVRLVDNADGPQTWPLVEAVGAGWLRLSLCRESAGRDTNGAAAIAVSVLARQQGFDTRADGA